MKSKKLLSQIIIIIFLLILGCCTCLPFVWMILSSFKTNAEIALAVPTLFPINPTLVNFLDLFTKVKFGLYLRTTLLVTLCAFLGLLFNAMAGYGFAKYSFKGEKVLFAIVLATMMIPNQVTMIPMYLLLHTVKLTNTLFGIVLPSLAGAFGIFLFRQFISTISDDFLEAARLDGAGEIYIFLKIILPLSKPILSVQCILTFVNGWNAFLWPLIVASDEKYYTLSVGLSLLQTQHAQNYSLLMAGAMVMIIPVIIIYFIFQKQIIKGISISSFK